MIFEYAISPSLFNTDDRIALLATSLGMDHGRLVSDFPKDKWEQFALAFIKRDAQGEVQLKAWKECLFSLKKRAAIVRRQAAGWDQSRSWSENAVEEHQRHGFQAIVDEKPNPDCAEVVQLGVPLAMSALWAARGDRHIDRQAAAMVDQIRPLLDISGTIVLIDRNFSIDGRFTNVLAKLANYVANAKKGPKVAQIKYVISDAVYLPPEMQQRCVAILSGLLPAGVSVKFLVKQKSKLHDRFVLTERGGLDFGTGLDEGAGQVLVKRLGYEAWMKEWNEWDKDYYNAFEIKA
ncbi:hypothetical protein [Cupriavidus sp. SW-Y-13]|uniref:hypothetical protein n=1 Tax=Cupriavidus sp. SW-Y-13 TaxID=2653854 RepID=UPI0013652BD8|nr:hypothetical protein [Cupriavidus sp. SW-Y-13]MWL88127.1 hypothetical protein [Cupriavidus sp. SW-Y-13]